MTLLWWARSGLPSVAGHCLVPPTVAGLAQLIETVRGEHSDQRGAVGGAKQGGDLPLSFGQQRLWFLDMLEPGSATYNIPQAVQIKGALNVVALKQSLDALVVRHESLRTTFDAIDRQPVIVIAPTVEVALPMVDLSHLAESERQTRVQQVATEEVQLPFDLSRGPLVRVSLLRLGAEEHVVLVTMHHIISDGWSLAVFFKELSEIYEEAISGRACSLPELPIQYADFAVWQRQWLKGEVLEKQLHYWREQLQGAPALLELPADHSRPAVQSHRGAHYPVTFSNELLEGLKELSRREGVTLYMTLLAAFKTLLFRHTNQDDVVVGSPIANRNRTELEGLIGYFANTIALRTDLSGNPTFRELLARVREVTLGAYDHQDMPFEKLVENLQPERSLSYNPLFQVLFGLHNTPTHQAGLSGLTLTPINIESGTSKFDLTLDLWEVAQGMSGTVEYNTDLFAGSSIARLIERFETLLRSIVADPEQCISHLPLLPETERHQLLAEWNDTRVEYPQYECIHQLFEAQVLRTPESVALIFGERRLTYKELNRQANQLAHYLRGLGVGPESLVGICVERSVEMIVAVLAVLKAGGAYVPLDPVYPKERVTLMLQDSQASVLLTQQKLVAGLSEHQAQVVCMDSDWQRITQESGENPISLTTPSNLAYVIYTSGSTGKPKGVAIEHRSTVAFLYWAASIFTTEHLRGVLASTSVCFDLSVYEMFAPLSCGGTIILVENVLQLPVSPAANQVTLINTVPSAITELLRIKGVPASVRTVNLAGEPLKTALVEQIYQVDTVKDVFDLYGPTEDTTYSTFTRRSADGQATIGRPISNTQAYILDRHLRPLPAGIPGELYLGGDGLARGYLNRPELTNERFVRNPFVNENSARLYKTGDLARYLATGEIEYLGRIDNQVKIRGYRIELGEIEAVLSRHPAVRETVVIAREDQPGDKRLVVYLVPTQGHAMKVKDFRSYLKQTLPDYMVPSVFVELDELPLTTNGKVNRKALPAPASTLSDLEAFVRHRDEVELQLVRIWEKILGIQPIGVVDNFFDLGGHSLQAIRMFVEVERVFGRSVPLATLFQAGTIEELAAILRKDEWAAPESSLVPIQPIGSKPLFFCIHAKGGNVLFNHDLSKHLGLDQPFYGLQARRVGGRQVGHDCIEEMAEFYIKEIRTLQPEGPYFFGGASFGGLAAYEIAQQLQARGHRVALLALFDTAGPGYPRLLPGTTVLRSKVYNFVRRVQHHKESLQRLDPRRKANLHRG